MGAGKSYLGQALAKQLGFDFVDLDDVIEKKANLSIAEVFEQHGESAFRRLEAEALRSFSASQNVVVATGGGAPCFHDNMHWMNENGITIYLHAPAELLALRLAPEKSHRPLISQLDDANLTNFIAAKLNERAPVYGESQLQFDVPPTGTSGIASLADYLERFFSK